MHDAVGQSRSWTEPYAATRGDGKVAESLSVTFRYAGAPEQQRAAGT
ncbi:hypothetical protein [Streptomyces sp. NPDC046805]